MADYVKMLELRLEHAATPVRVAKATRLLADLLQPLLPADPPGDEQGGGIPGAGASPVTVVVNNFSTSASVRVWDPSVVGHVQMLVDFIGDPTTSMEGDLAPLFAEAIAKYARDEGHYHPSFWSAQHRLRSVDERYAEELEAAIKQKRRIPPRFLVATYIKTPILGLRVTKANPPGYRAKIQIPGGKEGGDEVEVAPGARAAFSRAFEHGRETRQLFRVKVLGNWIRQANNRLEFTINEKLRATGIDDRVSTSNGPALVAEMDAEPILKRGETAGILRRVRSGEDDE
jgi:hypothetical protein